MRRTFGWLLLAVVCGLSFPHSLTAEEILTSEIAQAGPEDLIRYDVASRKVVGIRPSSSWSSVAGEEQQLVAPASTAMDIEPMAESGVYEKVTDSKKRPFSQAGLGQSSLGSFNGGLFSRKHVLSAGSAVFTRINDKEVWAWDYQFCPGYNELQSDPTPWGCFRAKEFMLPSGWRDELDAQYNYAYVELEYAIGREVGYLGFQTDQSFPDTATILTIRGDRVGNNNQIVLAMEYAKCTTLLRNSVQVQIDCTTGPASPGSPLIVPAMNIVGVVTHSTGLSSRPTAVKILNGTIWDQMWELRKEAMDRRFMPIILG